MKRRTLQAVPAILGALALAIAIAVCGKKAGNADRSTAVGAAMQEVGPFRISVRNRPEMPAVGDNRLMITVRDSSGTPIPGAALTVTIVMQAMGAMPRMESRGTVVETGRGGYEARYALTMAGEWDVEIGIRSSGGARADAAYRLSTSLKEIAFAGGTPPARAGGAAPARGAGEEGAVRIDPARRQAIGVKTAAVEEQELDATVRAAGRVAYDETRRAEVSLKFSGWVRDLKVDYVGRPVREGEVLFTAYSPELVSAQQEYLTALGADAHGHDGAPAPASPDLAQAARQRLMRWDITAAQIDAIARSGAPLEAVPIVAPAAGIVVEKSVVRGSAFTAGQALYKIAPTHPVWVIASVYPYELPIVRAGMAATILTPFLEQRSRSGRVAFVSPYLSPETRTAEVRIEAPNARGDLKPDQFVDVVLRAPLGKRLAVPESAVLYIGDRKVVFVDLGDERFAPRNVTLGAKAGDHYEVVAGLTKGEIVVTSGNFLIAAESRLKAPAQKR